MSIFVDKSKELEEPLHPNPNPTLHHDVPSMSTADESIVPTIQEESYGLSTFSGRRSDTSEIALSAGHLTQDELNESDPIVSTEANVTADEVDAIESFMDIAKTSLVNGKIEASVDALLQVVAVESGHYEANKLLGSILLAMQKYEVAEQFLYVAVDASKWTDSDAVVNLAQVLIRTNASELAIKALARGMEAVNNVDTSGTLSLGFGDAYFSVGNYSQAADWYLNSALKKPLLIERWIRASTLKFPPRGQDIKFAENVLLQAYSSNPSSLDIVFYLGVTMHMKEQLREAVLFYTEAIRMSDVIVDEGESSNENVLAIRTDAHGTLATALHALAVDSNRDTTLYQAALNTYVKAEQMNPTNEVLLSNFALFLKEIGRRDEGLMLSRRAFAINPTHPDVLRAVTECSEHAIAAVSNG